MMPCDSSQFKYGAFLFVGDKNQHMMYLTSTKLESLIKSETSLFEQLLSLLIKKQASFSILDHKKKKSIFKIEKYKTKGKETLGFPTKKSTVVSYLTIYAPWNQATRTVSHVKCS